MELLFLAFGAGVLSFLSPCTLPVYPSYLSYITGLSVSQISDRKTQSSKVQRELIFHTLAFVFGLAIVFFILGSFVSLLGDLFFEYQDIIRMLGAIVIVTMGLFLIGVFQPISLMKEKRIHLINKPAGYIGSFFIGIVFSAGWTPCIGPILTSVLAISATDPGSGLIYTTVYTLSFAIPFLVLAFFVGQSRWLIKYSNTIMKIGGVVMIIVGILLFFDKFADLGIWLSNLVGGFRGF